MDLSFSGYVNKNYNYPYKISYCIWMSLKIRTILFAFFAIIYSMQIEKFTGISIDTGMYWRRLLVRKGNGHISIRTHDQIPIKVHVR